MRLYKMFESLEERVEALEAAADPYEAQANAAHAEWAGIE
jgi:hypothetical protein